MALTKVQSEMGQSNAPAFSAYLSANQSITTTTVTKLNFDTEEYDTNSSFNNTGSTVGTAPSYSFNPQVAGYYQVSTGLTSVAATSTSGIYLYKNNVLEKAFNVTSSSTVLNLSALIYFNGSTDYLDCRGFLIGTTPAVSGTSGSKAYTYFQACLVRAA